MVNKELTQQLLAAVDAAFAEQARFLADLTRLPSLRCAEASAQDFMAAAFARRNLAVDRWLIDVADIQNLPGFSLVAVSYDNAWNVVGAWRPRTPRGRSLILNGHIDVVPTGPLDMWSHPPFDPRVDGDWMYGRGAGDMKAGLAAMLYAFDAIRAVGRAPAGDVYLQSVVEEECTGNGALACLQRGYRADAAIIPEPMEEHLMSAQVGVMWFQVKVRGKPAHVAVAGTGNNAIESCWPLIQALHRLEHQWNEAGHPAFAGHQHPLNFVVSKIEGGDWTSSVPSWCTFDMRIGMFPGMNLGEVRAQVESTIAAASANDPFLSRNPPQVVYHGFQAEGYELPRGTEAQTTLARAHAAVTGEQLGEVASTATTDARFFGLYAGIPAMVYGPKAENTHAFDERVSLQSMRRTTQAIALFIADWCGTEPA